MFRGVRNNQSSEVQFRISVVDISARLWTHNTLTLSHQQWLDHLSEFQESAWLSATERA